MQNHPCFPFSLTAYFRIRQCEAFTQRISWDMQAKKAWEEKQQARGEQNYWEIRMQPYWYDNTYGTNHQKLNGRIPTIEELKLMDKKNEKQS